MVAEVGKERDGEGKMTLNCLGLGLTHATVISTHSPLSRTQYINCGNLGSVKEYLEHRVSTSCLCYTHVSLLYLMAGWML